MNRTIANRSNALLYYIFMLLAFSPRVGRVKEDGGFPIRSGRGSADRSRRSRSENVAEPTGTQGAVVKAGLWDTVPQPV